MRWGSKGSLSLVIAGPKAGCWFDHELGRGGDILEFIRCERGCSFGEALDFAAEFVSELTPRVVTSRDDDVDDDEQRIEQALAIWDGTVPLRGTLAETYLRSRHIEVPEEALESLRFHRACPFHCYAFPTLVGLVRDIVTDEPLGIHRTPLTADGRKLGPPKLKGPTGGGAIKLAARQLSELTIGEGIETTLSATLLGFGPAWSAIDAGGIARFPVLPGIERLTIIVDNDIGGAGQRAASATRARWEAAGLRVRTVMPSTPGHDANDVLIARKGRP